MNKKDERKKLSKRKVMKEKKKNVERKKVKQKKRRTKKNKDDFFGVLFFFVTKMCREKKDEQGISKTSSKIKRFISRTLFKNKQTREQKKKGRKRKSRRHLHQFVGRKTTFFRYITTGKQKMRKLETIFQDTET